MALNRQFIETSFMIKNLSGPNYQKYVLVCLLAILPFLNFAQQWEIPPAVGSPSSGGSKPKSTSYKDVLYLTYFTGGSDFVRLYNGEEYQSFSALNDLVVPHGQIKDYKFHNAGDSLLFVSFEYRQSNRTHVETWSFDGENFNFISRFRPAYSTGYFHEYVLSNESGIYFLAPHNPSPSPVSDTLSIVRLVNNQYDTIAIAPSTGIIRLDGAGQNTLLVYGHFSDANNNSFVNYSYFENGNWSNTINNDIQGTERLSSRYLTNEIIMARGNQGFGTSNPERHVVKLNLGFYSNAGNADFDDVFGIGKHNNQIYLSAAFGDTTKIVQYDNGSYTHVGNNCNLTYLAGGSAPRVYGIFESKDYLYAFGGFGELNGLDVNQLVRYPLLNNLNLNPVAYTDFRQAIDTLESDFSVINNDSDVNGDYLNPSILIGPHHGTAEINFYDSISYKADIGFSGTDSVFYKVCDLGGLCDSAWLYIQVTRVSQDLVCVDDQLNILEDQDSTFAPLANDVTNGQAVQLSILQPATHVQGQVNGLTIDFIPDTTWFGTDSLQYKVCTTFGLCDSAWVYVNATLVNAGPTAQDDHGIVLAANSSHFITNNDTDPEGENLVATIIQGPFHPGATASIPGSYVQYNNLDFATFVKDSIQYEVCDIHNYYDTAWIHLAQNFAPIANDDYRTYLGPLYLFPLNNDVEPDGHPLTLTIVDGPFHTDGILSTNCSPDCYLYTNDNPAFENDSIQYSITDQYGAADTAWMFIENPLLHVQEQDLTSFKLFPNPVYDKLFIEQGQHEGPLFVQLYDASGRMILAAQYESAAGIDLKDLPAGVYLLHLESGAEKIIKKIIKE